MQQNRIEKVIELVVFVRRSFHLPSCVGLVIPLAVLGMRFLDGFAYLSATLWKAEESMLIPTILLLVSLRVMANFSVIAIITGYDSMVRLVSLAKAIMRPSPFGKLDIGSFKIRPTALLAAASSSFLRQPFLDAVDTWSDKLTLLAGNHQAFVPSTVLVAHRE